MPADTAHIFVFKFPFNHHFCDFFAKFLGLLSVHSISGGSSKGVLRGLALLSLSNFSSFSFWANSQVFGPNGGGRLGYFPLLVCIFSKSAMDMGSVAVNCWEASCGASGLVFFFPFSLVARMTSRTMTEGYVKEVKKQNR